MLSDCYHFVPPTALLCSSLFSHTRVTNSNCIPLRKSPHRQKLTFSQAQLLQVQGSTYKCLILSSFNQPVRIRAILFPASSTNLQLHETNIYVVDESEDRGLTLVRLHFFVSIFCIIFFFIFSSLIFIVSSLICYILSLSSFSPIFISRFFLFSAILYLYSLPFFPSFPLSFCPSLLSFSSPFFLPSPVSFLHTLLFLSLPHYFFMFFR